MWILIGLTMILLGLSAYSDYRTQTLDLMTIAIFVLLGMLYRGYEGTFYLGIAELVLRFVPGAFFLLLSLLKKEWVGMGDGILLLATGYLLGAVLQIVLLSVAFGISGIYGVIVLAIHKKSPKERIPFAPFLFISVFIVMIGMLFLKGEIIIA